MLDEQRHPSLRHDQQKYAFDQDAELDLLDITRFFYDNRLRLAGCFVLLLSIGLGGLFAWRFTRPLKVQGRLVLSFKGIEKGVYPDGRKFSIATLRSPDVVRAALMDAKLAGDRAAACRLSPDVEVAPIIPRSVAAKWAKQDKDGAPREEYFPSEYAVSFALAGLPREAGVRLFKALVRRYRDQEKDMESSTLRLATKNIQGDYYTGLLQDSSYEYEDIPRILDAGVAPLNASLGVMFGNAADPVVQAELKGVQNDLAAWSTTRLETLKALASAAGIVKNRETASARVHYRLNENNILIQQKTGEIAEAFKLLAAVQKPQPLLIGQAGKDSTAPDSVALGNLIGGNYISPVVRRIADLQQETKALEADKIRLEKDAVRVAQARVVAPGRLPAGYRDAVASASKELERIVGDYNAIVDRYLTTTVSNAIVVTDGPRVVREAPALYLQLAVIVLLSGLLAVLWVRLETFSWAAREETDPAPETPAPIRRALQAE